MSRAGYNDDWEGDTFDWIRWRGAVWSSIRGKRGQACLRETLAALDALPEKKLIAHELQAADGAVCALGALGCARGMDVSALDPEDYMTVAGAFNIAEPLAREVVYENDEGGPWQETPEHRFERMRKWVADRVIDAPPSTQDRSNEE
jgi:hypothetical protein